MIEFKTPRIEEEFRSWKLCHPRLRAMVQEISNMLDFFFIGRSKLIVVCIYRSPEENEQLYGQYKVSAHSEIPSRALDIAVDTEAHPKATDQTVINSMEVFVNKFFPRHDGHPAFLRHGEKGKTDHIHLSIAK